MRYEDRLAVHNKMAEARISTWRPHLQMIVLLFVLSYAAAQIKDNRCFLETGGSAENFFVSEDVPVGSVVGTLRIFGDPSERGGNIVLRLQELDSPVRIQPGTKNLTLTRKLDKEGIEGPSSVYVNVICDRKRTSDPGFGIPVSIRVTDANDNAPQFLNAPYILNISEVTVVGTRVLQGVKAVDADQQGPFSTVQYSVRPGPHSDYFVFVNGLEGTLLLRKPLDYEKLSNFTITIRAQDQGSPPQYSDTYLHVNVIDADDQNPRFTDERYTAVLPDNPTQGTQLRVRPREISAYDQDVGINAPIYYSLDPLRNVDNRYFEIDRSTGRVIIKRTVPDDDLLQPVTLVITATQYDNRDRYALATLTISRQGAPLAELQFLQSTYTVSALENLPLQSVLLTVVTNRPRDKRVRFWLPDPIDAEVFGVTPSGEIELRQSLDYETQDSYSFVVHASDGRTNASTRVNVSVLNVNDWDPRFRYPQYEFYVNSPSIRPGDVVGRVEAADGDRGDYVTLSLRGPAAKIFGVNEAGEIFITDMASLNTSTAHLVAVATDSGVPPRVASVPVIVHFPEALSSSWTPGGASFLLMVVFGALLGILALVIILLILYIYKHKRPKRSAGKVPGFIQQDKLPAPPGKVENPIFGNQQERPGTPQYTATVKTGRASSGSTVNLQPSTKHKVAPLPPTLPATADSASGGSSTTLDGSGSIPRRVKKLSWDDETAQPTKTELDPDVSVTPLSGQDDQMNLTVYF
ncbi:protocadherin beta-6 isoform X2 [Anabrus simplex]|uniref:protocadherin beta-6 isoform X2 n=1 Tax=Anabrus simplex TaxID=316456 RepID=UPI0035A32428